MEQDRTVHSSVDFNAIKYVREFVRERAVGFYDKIDQKFGPHAVRLFEEIMIAFGHAPGNDEKVALYLANAVTDGTISMQQIGRLPTFIYKNKAGIDVPLYKEHDIRREVNEWAIPVIKQRLFVIGDELTTQIVNSASLLHSQQVHHERTTNYKDNIGKEKYVFLGIHTHLIDAMINMDSLLKQNTAY